MARSPDSVLSRLEAFGIRLGLDNVRAVLAALGDPQRHFPAVLVAGSNGKGSTSSLIATMASVAGYRTGLYTSPHLETVEERLRIDGRPISPGRLGDLLAELVEIAEHRTGSPPTYFEALTVAAFRWFAAEQVDLAIVEVGMGGRLDATNVCEPILSLITSISLEHQEHLGETLSAIAREKAGILRRGRPALTWVEEPEAAGTVRDIAASLVADLRSAPELVQVHDLQSLGWEGQRIHLSTPEAAYDLRLSLLGSHQVHNLGLAVLAAETLAGLGFGRLDARAIADGAAACRWPGRLETFELPGGRRVLLDAAHNPEGAEVLASFLSTLSTPVDLLFGALADKDVAAMLTSLLPHVRRIVLTTPPSPRALDPHDVAKIAPSGVTVEPEPGRALEKALEGEPNLPLAVCGSIFLVGEIRRRLRERFGVPPPAAYISGS